MVKRLGWTYNSDRKTKAVQMIEITVLSSMFENVESQYSLSLSLSLSLSCKHSQHF